MTERRRISILIADDMPLVRRALSLLCETRPYYQVVAQTGDGEDALRIIEEIQPDIAVLELDLPRLFTLELVRKVRALDLPTKLVVLATRCDRKTVIEALRGGAHAFVLKSKEPEEFFDALEQVNQGGIYVSPSVALEKLFVPAANRAFDDPIESLSAREHQVFSLLIEGLRAKEIAARLDLSPKTVDTYRASLMRKLDIHDVAGLVKFAIQRNLTSVKAYPA